MRPPMHRGGGRGPPGRGGGFRGGRGGGGRFGSGRGYDEGPPEQVVEAGAFVHEVEGEMLIKLTNENIPYFNAGIFLENKTRVGKVEEVLGPINQVYFTVKPDTGVSAKSFKAEDKLYIGTDKLLPLSRFTGGGGGGGGRGRGGGR
ncbi:H/ACA ribonucleoprotein complex subunit 1, partial [Nannochloropsis gaditana CCMP526]|uniref:H/ACA ribonucleoprotein complex subunit 1 n=1 Tax=Nannochloropsis gaditana (strain CCMP526) TaxID=1093141 RepID=UPI00029F5541